MIGVLERMVAVLSVEEVYRPKPLTFELHPFEDRVLELVRLFYDAPTLRLRIIGTIAAGEPIEAFEEAEATEIHGPEAVARRHPHLPLLRAYLCPALQSVSGDAFEVARVITPMLAALKLSGKVPIDLDPWLFAGIALMVGRMGVAAFCAEHAAEADDVATARPLVMRVAAPDRRERRRTAGTKRPHGKR